jgi:hypothetical protein
MVVIPAFAGHTRTEPGTINRLWLNPPGFDDWQSIT